MRLFAKRTHSENYKIVNRDGSTASFWPVLSQPKRSRKTLIAAWPPLGFGLARSLQTMFANLLALVQTLLLVAGMAFNGYIRGEYVKILGCCILI